MKIETIADEIKQRSFYQSNDPVLIAIEGFGGSGKTTIAGKLKNQLQDASIVCIDDFIIKDRLAQASWDSGVFDRDRLERQVLSPARHHQKIRYQKLVWDGDTLSDFITIPHVRYLIVEGISSYHPDIARYYDYKIWVNTPIEIAKERGFMRNNAQQWGVWANNDLIYQQTYHPEKQADFVVDNQHALV
jgi:uridine kinase